MHHISLEYPADRELFSTIKKPYVMIQMTIKLCHVQFHNFFAEKNIHANNRLVGHRMSASQNKLCQMDDVCM